MADSRIPGLPDGAEITDFYFIMDKAGESSAVKVPYSAVGDLITALGNSIQVNSDNIQVNSDNIQVNTAAIANIPNERGIKVFSAYVLSNGLFIERVNNLLFGISLDGNDYQLNLSENIDESEFHQRYHIICIANDVAGTRVPAYSWEALNQVKIRFRDSSGNVQKTAFQLEIIKW